jgi:hypothetical protein
MPGWSEIWEFENNAHTSNMKRNSEMNLDGKEDPVLKGFERNDFFFWNPC